MVLHFTKRETCTIPSTNHDHDKKRNRISTSTCTAAATATSARNTPRKNATRLLNNSNNDTINAENEDSKTNQENDETLALQCCHGEFCSLIGVLDVDRDLVVLDGSIKKKKKKNNNSNNNKRGWGEEGQTQHTQKSRLQLEHIKSTPRKQKSLSRAYKHENSTSSISKQQDIDGRTRAYMILKKVLKKEELGALEDSGDITRFTIRDKIVVETGGLEGGDDLEHIRRCIPRQTIERSKVELRWKFLALQDLDEMGCNRHHQSDKHDDFFLFDSGGGGGGDATITSVASGMKPCKGRIMHGKTQHCYENDTMPVCDMCFHVYRLLTQVRCVQDELFCSKVLGTNEDVAFKLTLFVDKNSCTTVGGGGSGHDCHLQQQQEHRQEQQQQQQQQQYDCTGEKQDIQSQQVDFSWLLESDDDCERHGKATKVLVDGRSSEEKTKSPQSLKRSNSLNNSNNNVTVGILGNISERRKVRHENQSSEKTVKFKKIPISSSENPCSFNDGSSFNDPSSYRNEIKKFAIDDVTEIVYYVMERFMNKRSLKSSTSAATKKHKHVPSQGERCNLIVCHDLFETLERMQIFLSRFVERFAGQKILLWNYAGQAYTKFSERQCLNNEYHAKCLEKLMDHVGMDGTKEFVTSNSPYFVMGHGQGASIACLYAKARQHPNLRGLFLINPLSFIDTHYASVIHDCRNVFQCAPEERPDLPIYFYSRFLFSDKYLQKTSTALALNLYTAIYNPITLNGRIRLCDGVLNNVDLRDKVNNLLPPIVSVYGHDSSLIRPSLHAAAFVENRESCSTLHQVLHKKSAGRRSLVIMMEGGHELLQERKKDIHLLIEQLLTGKIMINYEGGNKHVAQNSIAVGDRSAVKPHWSASMPTFSQLVETVSDSVRKDNNQTHSTKNEVNKFDDDQIGGARNSNSNERGERIKCHISDKKMLLLNPNDPAFERHKNSIYKPKAGSIIYSTDVDGKSKQEYMSWRLRRNKKRLSRFQRAAKVIQGALRVYMAKTMFARLKRQTSALTIQRVYRGMVGRTIFLDKRKELWAACFVQRVYRGSLGRKTCYFTRMSQKSQVNIARIWRGYIGRKVVQQIVFQRISAAIQFQSLWRRFLAVKQVETLKVQHNSAIVVQKYYRGYKGRKDANEEREKYLFSRSQMRGIELGRNILAEHKTHATRLQSELHILAKEKEMLEGKVRQITKEIEKFQEQAESLEESMHQVCMAEVSLKSSIYSSARASADVMIREKKSQLDDEFSSLLLKISDRKNQLQLLEEKLTQIAKTKEQKGHDLRMLERKLVVLLEAQENELAAIRSRQQKKENSILKQTGAASKTNAMSTQHVELKPAGTASQQVSTFDSSNASKLMESTEAMMKFGFTSMSMTYFTALNMVKAMKSMSNQDIPLSSSEQISATLPGLQHSSENQSVQSMYTKKMKSPVSYWSVDHVVEWLKALSLGQYEDSFRDGSVDGPFLCELTDDDLMNVLGVEHKLHRKKLLLGISRLQSLNSNEGTTDTKNEIQMSSTTAASSLSSPLKSQATTSLKGSSVDITSSSSKVNLQQPLKLQNVERERTTGEIVNNIVLVQPSLDDLSRWVRNQKYTLLKEALGPFPNATFDPRDIRVQFMEGLGTIYVKSIADKPFHLNRCDEHGNTLMHIAAQNGNLRIAKLLMEKGANPNHQNKQGQTPGHFAVAYHFFDFASWLFDKNGGNGDDMILNMYGLGPYDGLVDDDEEEDEDIVIDEE